MDVKNCRKCRRLFNYLSGPQICPACREKLEEQFQQVKKYLIEHCNVGIKEVVEDCDVEEQQVRQWIREERLEFSKGIDVGIVCENCGTPISTGRFCEKCKAGILMDLKGAGRQPEQPKEPEVKKTDHTNKMRFIGR